MQDILTFAGSRRFLVGLGLVVFLFGSFLAPNADAGKKKTRKPKRVERNAEAGYVAGAGIAGLQDSQCVYAGAGCVILAVEDGERFVTVNVVDAAGSPVWASIYNNGYTDGSDPHSHVCGASDTALPIANGLTEVVVTLNQTTGGVAATCSGAATQGTVSVTFSNIP